MKKIKFQIPVVLPLLISHENKYVMGFLLLITAAFLYLASNHFHFSDPEYLMLSSLENRIPFLPYTIWIYLSEYILFVVIFFLCKETENLNRYFYAFLFMQFTSVLIFCLWPTIYPRELFPIPRDTDCITYFVFESLRRTDTAASCFPSLHVSSVYLSIFTFLTEQKNKFPFFLIWGTIIALSTLTTKQHYLVDIVAGFIMAILSFCIFRFCVSFGVTH
jgi:membrane-associated phospholipid phosphatase